MLSIDVRHPDIEQFISIKKDLTKVTGANISILLRDDFMEAVKNDEDYILRWPCNIEKEFPEILEKEAYDTGKYNILYPIIASDKMHGYTKKIRAKELWNTIIESAHGMAEPGLMFLDNHLNDSPDGVYEKYRFVTTNPCSEIGMSENDACRLMCVNLFSFVDNPFTKDARFDFKKFWQVCYDQQKLADDLVDLEAEHIDRILTKIDSDDTPEDLKYTERKLWQDIKEMALSSRRTGCGFTALGDTLAALNLKYDSDEALTVVSSICDTKMEAELTASIDMAEQRGVFKGFDCRVEYEIGNNRNIINGKNDFYQRLWMNFPDLVQRMIKLGRRNVSWSTVAPTGSVSILTATTSGIEPLFMPYYIRRKKINPSDKESRIDFTDQNGDNWQEYPILHPKFKDWYNKQDNTDSSSFMYAKPFLPLEEYNREQLDYIFSQSPWFQSTANDIDWNKRVELQSIVQQYTTHSISSTINLPNSATLEDVSNIYMKSWEMGLKGTTVYRDGCRTGVLVSDNKPKEDKFEYHDAIKRPTELPCGIHHTKVKGESFTIIVGLLDECPYEVFAIPTTIMENYTSGFLKKVGKGKYNLTCSLDEEVSIMKDITEGMTDEQEAITRLISISLRHGADIKFIVEQLLKTDGQLTSYTKAIARVLKQYIPDGSISTISCQSCGSKNVVFQEGCSKCLDCGHSACS